MSRWRAFAIHFGISLLIVSTVAFGLFYLWYPPHLLGFAKAETLFVLIAGIDLALGPLLTLIVFKSGKKSLKFDLTVIAILQAGFLAYGVWTAWVSRPVFLVGAIDRLELVFANEVADEDLAQAADARFRRLPWFGATLVGTRLPRDRELRSQALELALAGRDIDKRPMFYVPYRDVAADLLQRSASLAESMAKHPALQAELRAAQAGDSAPRTLSVFSSRGQALMLIDADTAQPIRALVGSTPQ